MQGVGRLRRQSTSSAETRYCCLGVLAAVAGFTSTHTEYLKTCKTYEYLARETQTALAMLNDHNRGFDQIADYIERTINAKEAIDAATDSLASVGGECVGE